MEVCPQLFGLHFLRNKTSSHQKTGKYEYDYIPCTAWRQTADFINKHFKDGAAIEITDARLQNNNWEKDGVKHYDLVVIVEQVEFPVNAFVHEKNELETQQSTIENETNNEDAYQQLQRIIDTEAQKPLDE